MLSSFGCHRVHLLPEKRTETEQRQDVSPVTTLDDDIHQHLHEGVGRSNIRRRVIQLAVICHKLPQIELSTKLILLLHFLSAYLMMFVSRPNCIH